MPNSFSRMSLNSCSEFIATSSFWLALVIINFLSVKVLRPSMHIKEQTLLFVKCESGDV